MDAFYSDLSVLPFPPFLPVLPDVGHDGVAQPFRVSRRVAADVVVEIRVNRYSFPDVRRKPLRPALERLIVVPAAVARRAVKADVYERSDRQPAGRRALHVVQAQRDAIALEQ